MNTASDGFVLAAAANGLCEQIERDGGDPAAALADAGVQAHMLADMRMGIDLASYVKLMEGAAARTKQDNFGLHYGQALGPERLGLIGAIALASPDLVTALCNITRLFPYHQQITETSLYKAGGVFRLEYRILSGHIVHRRQDSELKLGRFVNIIRHCIGSRWAPEEVHCEHARPDDWHEHERFFNAPVYFSQRTNAIVFKQEGAHYPMPGSNAIALNNFIKELRSLGRASSTVLLSDRVRSEIRSSLSEGDANLGAVAERLRLSRWRIQRELDRTGNSFAELLADVRRQLSLQYLRNVHLPLGEIAELLGYSELSAFTRSFNRWFGLPPSLWRAEHLLVDAG